MSEEEIIDALVPFDLTYKYNKDDTYPHEITCSNPETFWHFDTYAEIEAFISGLEHMRTKHKI